MISLAPPPPLMINERWLVLNLQGVHGPCFSFDFNMTQGFHSRMGHSDLRGAMNTNSYGATIYHTIDPITAIALGLVTPQDLNAPPGFEALLNLINK